MHCFSFWPLVSYRVQRYMHLFLVKMRLVRFLFSQGYWFKLIKSVKLKIVYLFSDHYKIKSDVIRLHVLQDVSTQVWKKKRSFWLIVATEVEVYFVYKQVRTVLGHSSRYELLEPLAGGCPVPKPATESVFELW